MCLFEFGVKSFFCFEQFCLEGPPIDVTSQCRVIAGEFEKECLRDEGDGFPGQSSGEHDCFSVFVCEWIIHGLSMCCFGF
jgi:hypothetical protein